MQLEVLIATPSGPFGELIRLTLEADPEYHCSLLDNSGELGDTLQNGTYQAVIFDCSFLQPEPAQVVADFNENYPTTALLLVPAENRADITPLQGLRADGLITRPFDSSLLPGLVKKAIQKKGMPAVNNDLPDSVHKQASWWSAFQTGIRDTAAASGMMIQNGMVIACTPDTSTALQQQVTASVMRFWNPDDAADLMRYVKDLVTGQEWMMYASKAADGAVLVLLFVPQTPVTKVRSQTLKLAKEIAGLMNEPVTPKRQPDSSFQESSEPPRLHDILGEKPDDSTPHIIKNGFPVEWFKEADLPDFSTSDQNDSEASDVPSVPKAEPAADEFNHFVISDLVGIVIPPMDENTDLSDSLVPNPEDESSSDSPSDEMVADQDREFPDSQEELSETSINNSSSSINAAKPAEMDASSAEQPDEDNLGNIQPVDLIAEPYVDNGLDSMQPIILQPKKSDTLPQNLSDEKMPELPAEPEIEKVTGSQADIPSLEIPIETSLGIDQTTLEEPVALSESALEEEEFPFLRTELTGESRAEKETQEEQPEVVSPEVKRILAESDATPIDVNAFQNELANLDLDESWNQIPVNGAGAFFGETPATPEEKSVPVEEPATFESEIDEVESPSAATGEPYTIEIPTLVEEPPVPDVKPTAIAENEPPAETSDDLYHRMNQLQAAPVEEASETYTIALIPRSDTMFIPRQFSAMLNQIMNRLCLAFNWKLDSLTIRPTYMQWTVTIPVSLSPEDMVNIVRKETTEELCKANPNDLAVIGEDFWAPRHMSATGKDFAPSIHWQNFILRRKSHEIA
jgi:hypothetical protein